MSAAFVLLDQPLVELEGLRMADSDLQEVRMCGIQQKVCFFFDNCTRNRQHRRLRLFGPRITDCCECRKRRLEPPVRRQGLPVNGCYEAVVELTGYQNEGCQQQ